MRYFADLMDAEDVPGQDYCPLAKGPAVEVYSVARLGGLEAVMTAALRRPTLTEVATLK